MSRSRRVKNQEMLEVCVLTLNSNEEKVRLVDSVSPEVALRDTRTR